MSNSATSNTIAKNTIWLLMAEFGSRIIVFYAVVSLINYLGDSAYGELVYAFSIANLLVVIADFGLSTYLVKELSRDLTQTRKTINTLLGLKILLMILTIGILFMVGILVGNIDMRILLIGGTSILLMNARVFIEAFFRAHQRMQYEAVTKIVGGVIQTITILYLIHWEASLISVVNGYVFSAIIALIIALVVLYKIITPFSIRFAWREYKLILIAAWPFAATVAMAYIFNYMDSAMLGFLNLKTEAAWYNAAYKPIFFVTALAGMIISAFFPVISKLFSEAKDRVGDTVQKLLKIQVILAIPMAVGGTLLAQDVINLLYKPEYQPATLAFQILVWSTALIYMWAVYGNSLQACDKQKIYMRGFAWGAVANIILNIILIPWFSLYGAAVATLLTQLFLLFFMSIKFKQIVKVPLLAALVKPTIAAVVMGMMLMILSAQSLWLLLPVGIVVYSITLFIIKGITIEELRFFKDIWQK